MEKNYKWFKKKFYENYQFQWVKNSMNKIMFKHSPHYGIIVFINYTRKNLVWRKPSITTGVCSWFLPLVHHKLNKYFPNNVRKLYTVFFHLKHSKLWRTVVQNDKILQKIQDFQDKVKKMVFLWNQNSRTMVLMKCRYAIVMYPWERNLHLK